MLATATPSRRSTVDALESLRLAATELADAPSVERVAAVLAQTAVEALDADTILVGISDNGGRHLRVVHERGLSTTRTLRSAGAALDAVAETLVAADDGPAQDPRSLAALIPAHERPLGIVVVGRRYGGDFAHEERRFLEALAAVAGLALERVGSASDPRRGRGAAHRHYQLADMQIDLADQEVVLGDRHVHLTPSELRILLFLAAEPGRVRTRQEILRHVWHTDHVGDERACDAHISNLRRKIERDPSRPTRVVTIRSVGYALILPVRP